VYIYEYLNNFAALYRKEISLANTGKSGEAMVIYDRALAMDPRNVGLSVFLSFLSINRYQ
jgi:hypothetical protein